MKEKNWIGSNKIFVAILLLALIVAAFITYAYSGGQDETVNPAVTESYPTPVIKPAGEPVAENQILATTATGPPEMSAMTPGTSKVVLQVDGMSCSGCISTIKSSLAGFDGIRDVIVNVSGGIAEIYFDAAKIKNVDQLASAVTASGYPAKIDAILTADQIKKEEAVSAARAKFYIASVSGWDIARSDFSTELTYAKKRYQEVYGENVFSTDRGKILLDSIKAQVVSRLINDGIQMQEVQRAGYRIDPQIVDQEFEEFIAQKDIDVNGLKTTLEKNGYPFDYYMKKFESSVLLRHYLEDKVFNDAAGDDEKRQEYLAWFNNARVLSKVVIYDKELERLTQNQSSGGSCCSTGKS